MLQFFVVLGILQVMVKVTVGQFAGDTLTAKGSITDGQSLISAGGIFQLGFFSPSNSTNKYLGIWYYNMSDQTVVWIANRDNPLDTSVGTLNLTADGNLVLYSGDTKIWSSGTLHTIEPVLQLRDSGNLVLVGGSSKSTVWQSFDYPCDTFLPGMKLGVDFKMNLYRQLRSWKSANDPSSGDYSYTMEIRGVPQTFIHKGSSTKWRSGPWNGQSFSGRPDMGRNSIFQFEYVSDQDEVYYSFKSADSSVLTRAVINSTGVIQRALWSKVSNSWDIFWTVPQDTCDNYATCGVNSICNPSITKLCQCLQGFVPKSSKNWDLRQYSDGCIRRTALACQLDGFLLLQNIKLPDSINATTENKKTSDECESWCLQNCSCMAYAISGANCFTWFGDLVDLRIFNDGGDELHVRLAASDLGTTTRSHSPVVAIALAVGLAFLFFVVIAVLYLWCKKKKGVGGNQGILGPYGIFKMEKEQEFPSYELSVIRVATNDFSDDNKVGEGGFGIVYKGRLGNGQQIAVKKLSRYSWQGPEEFKNELELIANLQHRNLIRLLGCCIEGDERILILDYMENKSLDNYIYADTRTMLLDWGTRLNIIFGIARGLLYLHCDSYLHIVHRDLKPSNILLDKDMNPKISDFGISRIFEGDEVQEKSTRRAVGTIGYMAPEYAFAGVFSFKSDVFSFGVIVLELLSGKRNIIANYADTRTNLLGHVYRMWKEGRSLEIIDNSPDCSFPVIQLLRCINVGLLCVQENAEDRPTMAEVIAMLSSEGALLSEPKKPNTGIASSSSTKFSTPKEMSSSIILAGR